MRIPIGPMLGLLETFQRQPIVLPARRRRKPECGLRGARAKPPIGFQAFCQIGLLCFEAATERRYRLRRFSAVAAASALFVLAGAGSALAATQHSSHHVLRHAVRHAAVTPATAGTGAN